MGMHMQRTMGAEMVMHMSWTEVRMGMHMQRTMGGEMNMQMPWTEVRPSTSNGHLSMLIPKHPPEHLGESNYRTAAIVVVVSAGAAAAAAAVGVEQRTVVVEQGTQHTYPANRPRHAHTHAHPEATLYSLHLHRTHIHTPMGARRAAAAYMVLNSTRIRSERS